MRTDNAEKRNGESEASRDKFGPILLFSTIFPNLRVFSATNAFQPLAPFLILANIIVTRKVNKHAGRFAFAWVITTATVFLLHGEIDRSGLIYTFLYMVGPLLMCYAIPAFARPSKQINSVITIGLATALISVAEQFLIGSAAIEHLYSVLFAGRGAGMTPNGGRGMRGFTAEPSHVGRLFATFVLLAFAVKHPRCRMWGLLALPFIAVNRSASAFFLLAGLAAALTYRKSKWLAGGFAALAIAGLPYVLSLNYRFADELGRMLSAFQGDWSQGNLVDLLGEAGGRRIIQTAVGYMSVLQFPFGNGPASYLTHFRDVGSDLGFNLSDWYWYTSSSSSVKPGSYVSQIVFDYGVLALPAVLVLWKSLRTEFRISHDPLRLACFGLGLVQVLFVSTTTIPWPWLLIAAGFVPIRASNDGASEPDRAPPPSQPRSRVQNLRPKISDTTKIEDR